MGENSQIFGMPKRSLCLSDILAKVNEAMPQKLRLIVTPE